MSTPSGDAVQAGLDSFRTGLTLGTVVTGAAATTASAPPAGGSGATAGAFADAATRDSALASINNLRIDHEATFTTLSNLITVLKANRLIPQ